MNNQYDKVKSADQAIKQGRSKLDAGSAEGQGAQRVTWNYDPAKYRVSKEEAAALTGSVDRFIKEFSAKKKPQASALDLAQEQLDAEAQVQPQMQEATAAAFDALLEQAKAETSRVAQRAKQPAMPLESNDIYSNSDYSPETQHGDTGHQGVYQSADAPVKEGDLSGLMDEYMRVMNDDDEDNRGGRFRRRRKERKRAKASAFDAPPAPAPAVVPAPPVVPLNDPVPPAPQFEAPSDFLAPEDAFDIPEEVVAPVEEPFDIPEEVVEPVIEETFDMPEEVVEPVIEETFDVPEEVVEPVVEEAFDIPEEVVEPVIEEAFDMPEEVVEPVVEEAFNIPEEVVEPVVEEAFDIPEEVVEPVIEEAFDVPEEAVEPVVEEAFDMPEEVVEPVVEEAFDMPEEVVEPVIEEAFDAPEEAVEPAIEEAFDMPEEVVEPVVEEAFDAPEEAVEPAIEEAFDMPEEVVEPVIEEAFDAPEEAAVPAEEAAEVKETVEVPAEDLFDLPEEFLMPEIIFPDEPQPAPEADEADETTEAPEVPAEEAEEVLESVVDPSRLFSDIPPRTDVPDDEPQEIEPTQAEPQDYEPQMIDLTELPETEEALQQEPTYPTKFEDVQSYSGNEDPEDRFVPLEDAAAYAAEEAPAVEPEFQAYLQDPQEPQQEEAVAAPVKRKKEHRFLRGLGKFFCSIFLIASLLATLVVAMIGSVLGINSGTPTIGDYYLFTSTNTYEKTGVDEGDLVICQKTPAIANDTGVVYIDAQSNSFSFGVKISDRVDPDSNALLYDISGTTVSEENLLGTVMYTVPQVGVYARYIIDNFKLLIAGCAALDVLWILFLILLSRRRREPEDELPEEAEIAAEPAPQDDLFNDLG